MKNLKVEIKRIRTIFIGIKICNDHIFGIQKKLKPFSNPKKINLLDYLKYTLIIKNRLNDHELKNLKYIIIYNIEKNTCFLRE